jgi:tRNA pseudouridine55 synthase
VNSEHLSEHLQGALLVDKPAGPTSHDVVAFVRRTLKTSRVGHTGTLDPLATGLLVILVGPATRTAQFLAADEKEYIADVRVGVATPTYDAASLADGVRYPIADSRYPMDAKVEAVLARFRGSFLQTPPPFSAKKIASVPAYEKARKNQPVDLKPVPVTVRALELLDASDIGYRVADVEYRLSDIGHDGLLRLRVAASAGFYVRSLAHDLGQALGWGAHLEALRRTRVGRFRVEDALTLDKVEASGAARLVRLNDLLGDMPLVALTAEGARRAAHGNSLAEHHLEKGDRSLFGAEKGDRSLFRVRDGDGRLLAVAERRPDGLLHPLVVLG